MKRLAPHAIALLFASMSVADCGSSGSPTSPTATPTIADISGTWTQVSGGARTWSLIQASVQAGGNASFSQNSNANFGVVSGTGGVVGAVTLFGTFMFAETYDTLSIPSRPTPNFCWVDVQGQLTINGNTMSGSYTETYGGCAVHLSQITGTLTMQRK